jgi:hypothetical protein
MNRDSNKKRIEFDEHNKLRRARTRSDELCRKQENALRKMV